MTLQEAVAFVLETLGRDKAVLWWHHKNPNLGNMTPNDMIKLGREEKLLRWIQCVKEENRWGQYVKEENQ